VKPTIFRELDFEAAKDVAAREKKLLLVVLTSRDCAECETMQLTTWSDARVVEGLKDRAIVIAIDADETRGLGAQFGFDAQALALAFRDGREIERLRGQRTPIDVLIWFEELVTWKTPLEEARIAGEARPDATDAQLVLARELARSGAFSEAAAHYLRVVDRIPKTDAIDAIMYRVERSFFFDELKRRPEKHLRGVRAITAMRDRFEPPPAAIPDDLDALEDWVLLNDALRESEKSLRWFDATRDALMRSERRALFERVFTPVLITAGRWRDAGELAGDPLGKLSTGAAYWEITKTNADFHGQSDHARDSLRKDAAMLIRAMRAAGRTDDERAVREEALKIDPSDEMRAVLDEAARHDDA
jgi:hypothetical protein